VGADEKMSGLKGGGGGSVEGGHLDTTCQDACVMLYSVSMPASSVYTTEEV